MVPGSAADPLAPHLAAAAALLAVDEVMAYWASSATDADLLELVDDAFDLLRDPLSEGAGGGH